MNSPTHFDVVIVGAGISGIGAAYHLQKSCPDRSYTILDGRDRLGGTWDLFRYPGIRSDSDMYTLGYSFKPWKHPKSIADGPSILQYLEEAAEEFGIDRHMRFGRQVSAAHWSSEDATWTLETQRKDSGKRETYTCNFLVMCAGYYSYRGGYTPDFEGIDRFKGRVVHPQQWPENLDYAGKRIVVIGSGATAVTLVPSLAEKAEHVTMLQRTPTYIVARPDSDSFADTLRKFLPERTAYRLTRRKNMALTSFFYRASKRKPERVKKWILENVRNALGPGYDVEKNFLPPYDPWDQRVCLAPNGDFFAAIKGGKASVVTDRIDTFTERGIRLESGDELEADIVVTATGLNLVTLGEMDFTVDGEAVDFSKTWTYKGLAYSDVPNLLASFGYVSASWTLRVDFTCELVCRLLNHMKATGTDQCTPRLRPSDHGMQPRPWITDFNPGYVLRMFDKLPKQGDREPWINTQHYAMDVKLIRNAPIDDGVMRFTKAARRTASADSPELREAS